MGVLSWLVFVPLQILWIPISIVGMVMVGYNQMVVSKRLGVSQTAIEVFNGRWTMHLFELRRDPATVKLGEVLPNTSTRGLWLVLLPFWVKWKISGELAMYPRVVPPGEEGLGELVVARTVFFDRILARHLVDADQFVLMGAGYDTRPYGTLELHGARVFEVDQLAVQNHKREMLAEAGIDTGEVTFVAVDFAKDKVFDKLSEAGFERAKKTVFLWEGVTLYLSEGDVRRTMRQVRDNSPGGSVLVADVYAMRFIDMASSKASDAALSYTDENVGFGLPFDLDWDGVLRSFVESESLTVGQTDFMGSSNDKGPFMVVVEMMV